MSIDAEEAAIRTVIANTLVGHVKPVDAAFDALYVMRQAEAIVKALKSAGYEIKRLEARWPPPRPTNRSSDDNPPFPAPWRADKMPGGYVVRDPNGQALVLDLLAGQRSRSAAGKGADERRGAAASPAGSPRRAPSGFRFRHSPATSNQSAVFPPRG